MGVVIEIFVKNPGVENEPNPLICIVRGIYIIYRTVEPWHVESLVILAASCHCTVLYCTATVLYCTVQYASGLD
jgi:hypothetical protein